MGTVTYLKTNYQKSSAPDKKNIFQFPLAGFFHQVFEEVKKRQDDIKKRKTDFLYKKAYQVFLDEYLMKNARERIIDFPAFMYLSGKIICTEAKNKAEEVMLQIIKDDRVNELYSKGIKG